MELTTLQAYQQLFDAIKQEIQQAKLTTVVAVNQNMLLSYWKVGNMILQRQEAQKWGAKVIQQLEKDLKIAYPNLKGYSYRNLNYMRKFAFEYPDFEFVQEPLAQMTWYHNILLMEKIHDRKIRLWYAAKVIENGWSTNVMSIHIERKLHEIQGKLPNNFERTLPKPQSDLAQQMFKDSYLFDFLNVGEEALERDIEEAMTRQITKFLLELGQGFAFVGRQYKLDVDGEDFKVDLLFYHLKLHAYVAIDLKARQFKPEDAGKIAFYTSVIDDILRGEHDNPTIGIVLCKEKNNVRAEYALRTINAPIGISEFKLTELLPEDLQLKLPSIEALEQALKDIKKPKK